MRLVKATPEDNGELLRFFNSTITPGPVDLRVVRQGDFFAPYRIGTDDFVTYMLLDEQEQIAAVATLIFRPGYLNGKFELIGYATDLRVASTRRAILSWSQFFLPVLEQERQSRGCKYVFTVVPQGQRQAYNAFVRPRTARRNLPRYHLVRNFNIVSIHGELPFTAAPLNTLSFRQAQVDDRWALSEYIANKNRQYPMCFNATPESVLNQIDRWPNLKLHDFWLALSREGRLVGCVAPWSPSKMQNYDVIEMDLKARTLADTLAFFRWFGFTRPLMDREDRLHFQFLTHFHADNPDIFLSLIGVAWRQIPTSRFFVYPQFENDYFRLPARGHIASKVKCGLYCILAPSDPVPEFLRVGPNSAKPPEMELALL